VPSGAQYQIFITVHWPSLYHLGTDRTENTDSNSSFIACVSWGDHVTATEPLSSAEPTVFLNGEKSFLECMKYNTQKKSRAYYQDFMECDYRRGLDW
jgi:hypothetical protein